MDQKENKKVSVLYVDDEAGNLQAFKAAFRRLFTVHVAENAAEGMKILDEQEVHVVLTDQRMPGITGIEFLQSILEKHPNPIRILVTGYSDIEVVKAAINNGQVYKYVDKPWDNDRLKMNIENAYEVYRLREENKQLTKDLERVNQQLEFMLRQKLIS
ncbi:MAG: response regulator [Flavobacteriales bacterium]|nr:response regulator [Flavobacteriales bacterium]